MGTADEVAGVVLPTNGLILVGFTGALKSSVTSAGHAAIFLGSVQVKSDQGGSSSRPQEASTALTVFRHLSIYGGGLLCSEVETWGGDVTTGQIVGGAQKVGTETFINTGGLCPIFVGAGTYAVNIQYKSSSGTVTAKERKLWVATLGY